VFPSTLRHACSRNNPPVDREALIRTMYAAFNARDIDGVLGRLAPDVDWPNAWEGGRVHGHDGVRDYWTRQWAAIDPHVTPTGFTMRDDGSVAVDVHQVARSLDGTLVAENDVRHVYAFRDDLVTRMDVEDDERN
jgi:ketosteroid isomerase-like protein